MARLILDYYDGKNIYNDGDVEQQLINHYKDGVPIDFKKDNVFYLTTDVRANILNWYPFTKKDTVLEIGCGCGTLTGTLCEKCKSVVCVEGSKRRAEVTYYRHQKQKDLEVYAGNFDDIKINQKFDYIVLIGVFEYAKLFFNSDTPFDDFLIKIKNLLKPTGKVLLAIENRYGIKYWAGANEDHVLKPYVGLEGYDSYSVQTFGKTEFVKMIEKHGFVNSKFYYPFPDYKLPTIIYTDERLPKENEIASLPIYPYGNKMNFNVRETLRGLIENETFGFFSNSFLVEFGFSQSVLSDITYARNLDYRSIDFKTITIENSNREIIKIPDNTLAKKHLDRLVEIHKKAKAKNIKICDVKEENGKYLIERIDGYNVAEYIQKLSINNQWNLVESEINKLVSFYHSISVKKEITNPIINEIKKVYKNKTYIMKLALIDGNASNIIRNNNGEYIFIDQEWEIDKELPTDYLIYYSLSYIFGTNSLLSKHFSFEHFCKKYDISKKKIALFNEIENYYFNKYQEVVDKNKKHILDCCSMQDTNEEPIWTVVYFDDGNGFCEENKIVQKYSKGKTNDEYTVDFILPKKVLKIRFDPIITGNKLMNFRNIKVNGKSIIYDEYNVKQINNKKSLVLEHPFIVFPFTKEKLSISIKLEQFTEEDKIMLIKDDCDLEQEIERLNKENIKIYEELELIKNERETVEKELDEIKNSKYWSILRKIIKK